MVQYLGEGTAGNPKPVRAKLPTEVPDPLFQYPTRMALRRAATSLSQRLAWGAEEGFGSLLSGAKALETVQG